MLIIYFLIGLILVAVFWGSLIISFIAEYWWFFAFIIIGGIVAAIYEKEHSL